MGKNKRQVRRHTNGNGRKTLTHPSTRGPSCQLGIHPCPYMNFLLNEPLLLTFMEELHRDWEGLSPPLRVLRVLCPLGEVSPPVLFCLPLFFPFPSKPFPRLYVKVVPTKSKSQADIPPTRRWRMIVYRSHKVVLFYRSHSSLSLAASQFLHYCGLQTLASLRIPGNQGVTIEAGLINELVKARSLLPAVRLNGMAQETAARDSNW